MVWGLNSRPTISFVYKDPWRMVKRYVKDCLSVVSTERGTTHSQVSCPFHAHGKALGLQS